MKKYPNTFFIILLFLLSINSFSQKGWWTWMHGSNIPNSLGNFGTQGVAAPTNEPPAVYEPCEWTDNQGRFWMFGGVDVHNILSGFDCYNTLWMYDPATNMWTWVNGTSVRNSPGVYGTKGVAAPANTPGARTFAPMTWVDNQNNLWLYAGQGYDATVAGIQGPLADLWKYNIATNEWTWVNGYSTNNHPAVFGVKGVPSPANFPGSRNESSVSWTDNNNNLWFYGGVSVGSGYNDTWKYNIATDQWTWMHGTNVSGAPANYGTQGVPAASNVPSERNVYAKWKDKSGNFWMFGGSSGGGYQNDLWKFDVSTNMWTWMRGSNTPNSTGTSGSLCSQSPTFDPPSGYENRACWVDSCDNFWLFGGRTINAQNEFWSYNVGLNQWTKVGINAPGSYGTINTPAASNLPPDRFGAIPFTDKQNNLWLFGGAESIGGNYFNDLWKFVIDTACVPWCTLNQNPNAGFTATNLSGCAPLTVTFTNTSTNSTSWNWNFGDGNTSTTQNPVHTYTAAGTYTVTQIAYNGPNSDTLVQPNYVTVGQSPVLNTATTNSVSCNGGNNGSATVNISTGIPSYTYLWSNGQTTSAAVALSSGSYTVTVIDASGCSATQTLSITQPVALSTSVTNTPASCNNSDGTATTTAGGGTGPYTYLWSNGGTTSQISNLTSQIYSVTITDANGCTKTATTTILNSNGPTAITNGNATIQSGNSTTLLASGGISYSWSPASGLNNSSVSNPTASPTTTTTYCVFVFDSVGCYDSSCVTVTVIPEPIICGTFYIPNAFSPNEDNENEVFKAYIDPSCVLEFKLVIYNRWGEKVFESNDVTKSWDGYFRGTISNSAVYAFYCNAILTNGKEINKKGNVSLVR